MIRDDYLGRLTGGSGSTDIRKTAVLEVSQCNEKWNYCTAYEPQVNFWRHRPLTKVFGQGSAPFCTEGRVPPLLAGDLSMSLISPDYAV